jgi:hypothetical protein
MKSTHHVVSGLLAYHVNHGTARVLLDLHVLYYFKIWVTVAYFLYFDCLFNTAIGPCPHLGSP